jgi:phytanoyl-CoA hydroxylase
MLVVVLWGDVMIEQRVSRRLETAQVSQYHQDGYVIVPGLFREDEVLVWKQHVINALRELGDLGNRSGVHVWMCEKLDANLQRWVTDPRLVDILVQLVGPDVEFLSVKSVFKNKDLRFGSPWHQDWFYWNGSNKISVWVALDDAAPENGCLRLIPGTHHKVYELARVDEGNGFNLRVPDEVLHGLPVVTAEVKRGDAIFFHDLTLHSSCENSSGADRWSLISTYRESSVHDDSNVWQSSIPLHGR